MKHTHRHNAKQVYQCNLTPEDRRKQIPMPFRQTAPCEVTYVYDREGRPRFYQNYYLETHLYWTAADFDGFIPFFPPHHYIIEDLISQPTLPSAVYSPHNPDIDKPPLL